jgi:hypothetical protein
MVKDGFEETSLIILCPDRPPFEKNGGLPENAADLKEIILAVAGRPDAECMKHMATLPNFTLQTHPGIYKTIHRANLAAASARGRYLVFLFGKQRPGNGWLADLLEPLIDGDESAAALPPGEPGGQEENTDTDQNRQTEKWILAPLGSAFAIKASRFRHIVGFDPDLEESYALCDLGFRLWLSGGRIAASGPPSARSWIDIRGVDEFIMTDPPDSAKPPELSDHLCLEIDEDNREDDVSSLKDMTHYLIYRSIRDRLYTIYKNYEEGEMARRLALNICLAIHAAVQMSRIDPSHWAFPRRGWTTGHPLPPLTEAGLACLMGIQSLTAGLPRLRLKRKAVQALRKARDGEIFSRVKDPFTVSGGAYSGDRLDWRALEKMLNIPEFDI